MIKWGPKLPSTQKIQYQKKGVENANFPEKKSMKPGDEH
jgi:hypothetical protein